MCCEFSELNLHVINTSLICTFSCVINRIFPLISNASLLSPLDMLLLLCTDCILFVACNQEQLTLDFQNIVYDITRDRTEVGIDYYGHCGLFVLQFFTLSDILLQGKLTPISQKSINSSNATVFVTSDKISVSTEEQLFFRVLAKTENGIACSDNSSHQTFYQMQMIGKKNESFIAMVYKVRMACNSLCKRAAKCVVQRRVVV